MFCPRCQGGRCDHVDVGWFQGMCHINGVEWPVPPQRSTLVASLSLSMLVGRDAHSACNHCASLLSLLFSRQPLFSMDTQWTSLVSPPTEEPSPPEHLSLLCCCRVGPPPQFEPMTSRVAHRNRVECAVIDPTWWWIFGAQVSESVLVVLAREHHISVAREPPSWSLPSPTDVQWSVVRWPQFSSSEPS